MSKKRYPYSNKKSEIKEFLHQIFFCSLSVSSSDVQPINAQPSYVATYINDQNEIVGMIRLDMTLSGAFSILFTDMLPELLDEIIEASALTQLQKENLAEIMNILSQIFTWRKHTQVKLHHFEHIRDIEGYLYPSLQNAELYDAFDVELEGFPPGVLHIYSTDHAPIALEAKEPPLAPPIEATAKKQTNQTVKKTETVQKPKKSTPAKEKRHTPKKKSSLEDVNLLVVFGLIFLVGIIIFYFTMS